MFLSSERLKNLEASSAVIRVVDFEKFSGGMSSGSFLPPPSSVTVSLITSAEINSMYQNTLRFCHFHANIELTKRMERLIGKTGHQKVAGSIPAWGSEIIFGVSSLKIVHLP